LAVDRGARAVDPDRLAADRDPPLREVPLLRAPDPLRPLDCDRFG
jgi:hypothetical protein